MNKKLIAAVGLVLMTGVGAACWRTLRNGVFNERACAGPTFSITGVFVPTFDFAELRDTSGDSASRVLESSGTRCAAASARGVRGRRRRGDHEERLEQRKPRPDVTLSYAFGGAPDPTDFSQGLSVPSSWA